MSFQQGLSGLNATSKNLEVIGNNVANANTFGEKSSRAEFADMVAASINGASTVSPGIGVNLATVAQQFTQGNITTTENPLDLAINGNGFFQVNAGGAVEYTRNGQFKLDRDGRIDGADARPGRCRQHQRQHAQPRIAELRHGGVCRREGLQLILRLTPQHHRDTP